MLIIKKINIIRKNEEFKKIINSNKPYRNDYFLLFINNNNLNFYRFGISISKKIGSAVVRNKLKRQIKNILDEYKKEFKNTFDCIIIVDMKVKDLKYFEIKRELIKLINETQILKEGSKENE